MPHVRIPLDPLLLQHLSFEGVGALRSWQGVCLHLGAGSDHAERIQRISSRSRCALHAPLYQTDKLQCVCTKKSSVLEQQPAAYPIWGR